MSYEGVVCKLHTRPHPNANKLQLGTANGYQVVTQLDTPDQALGVFFQADTQLDHDFCLRATLYRKHPKTGEVLGGYLEHNRRVRTLKLRGEISDGLWLPIALFDYLGVKLSEGDLVGKINDITIARKYMTPATRRRLDDDKKAKKNKKAVEIEFPTFFKHFDTAQLRINASKIPAGALLIFSEKLHGTSARSAHLLRVTQPKWYHRWLSWLGVRPQRYYDRVYGSRNVVYEGGKLPVSSNPSNYTEGGEIKSVDNYRRRHHLRFDLHKGETVYYEIVGWEGADTPIMQRHDLSDKDPVHQELRKEYGVDSIVYNYSCPAGSNEIYIYRITQTNEDGYVVELPWDAVLTRCHQLGLRPVPELERTIYDGNVDNLLARCAQLARGRSTLGQHLREGVCVRVQHAELDTVYKYKGWEFCHLEGIAKQDDNFVDPEDVA